MAYHGLPVELYRQYAVAAAYRYLAWGSADIAQAQDKERLAGEFGAEYPSQTASVETEFLVYAVLQIDYRPLLGIELLPG